MLVVPTSMPTSMRREGGKAGRWAGGEAGRREGNGAETSVRADHADDLPWLLSPHPFRLPASPPCRLSLDRPEGETARQVALDEEGEDDGRDDGDQGVDRGGVEVHAAGAARGEDVDRQRYRGARCQRRREECLV